MGSIPAGNVRMGYKLCKNRDNTDCASLLADNSYYLFFYRATPATKKAEGLRVGMACSVIAVSITIRERRYI